MNTEIKNLSESVYAKLKNLALTKKRPTQEVLLYYGMERFLYRLSISQYKNTFFLKGGLMLLVWDPSTHRATVDIDLLARTHNSTENIAHILKEISSQPVSNDGIEFNSNELKIIETQIETEYTGLSAKLSARLHTASFPIRLDIGFSDKIYPKPAELNYPTLLNFPSPKLKGYTPETMIAEKLDAMIRLGAANTRMKDFYDIWTMLQQFNITVESISPTIREVFHNRNTNIPELPKAFSEEFYKAPKTLARWDAFLKGIGVNIISFEEVIKELQAYFTPIFSSLN